MCIYLYFYFVYITFRLYILRLIGRSPCLFCVFAFFFIQMLYAYLKSNAYTKYMLWNYLLFFFF